MRGGKWRGKDRRPYSVIVTKGDLCVIKTTTRHPGAALRRLLPPRAEARRNDLRILLKELEAAGYNAWVERVGPFDESGKRRRGGEEDEATQGLRRDREDEERGDDHSRNPGPWGIL